MTDIILWILVIFLYSVSVISLIYILIIASSFFQETPYITITNRILEEVIKELDLSNEDVFIYIGFGDCKVVRYVKQITGGALHGYFGMEVIRPMVIFSKLVNLIHGKNRYYALDLFNYVFTNKTKVFMYITPPHSSEIFKKLVQELKKGSIIVSGMFPYKEDINKKYRIESKNINKGNKEYKIYKYIV